MFPCLMVQGRMKKLIAPAKGSASFNLTVFIASIARVCMHLNLGSWNQLLIVDCKARGFTVLE